MEEVTLPHCLSYLTLPRVPVGCFMGGCCLLLGAAAAPWRGGSFLRQDRKHPEFLTASGSWYVSLKWCHSRNEVLEPAVVFLLAAYLTWFIL